MYRDGPSEISHGPDPERAVDVDNHDRESGPLEHVSQVTLESTTLDASIFPPDTLAKIPPSQGNVLAAEKPYSSFSSRQRTFIVLTSTLGAAFSPFSANVYLPAIDTISRDLGVSVSKVYLTITTYMIFQGIAPSFISAIADVRGRRPAYVVGFTIYMAANLGLALNNSYAGLLVLRCLQSSGSSGLTTLNQGVIADIVTSAERGKYISITSLSSILAPSVAPISGGLLVEYLGWHSIFWFLLIMSALYLVPLTLFFPETARSIVGDGSIEPSAWNRTLPDIIRERSRPKAANPETNEEIELTEGERRKMVTRRQPINPFKSLYIIYDSETGLLLVAISVIYAGFYAVTTSVTVQFARIYHLSATLQGLLFLPQAVGAVCAAITNSRLLDYRYRAHASRVGVPTDRKTQIDILTTPMPIERARLEIAIPMLAVSCLATIIYGWLLHAKVSIVGPIILLTVMGYTALTTSSIMSVLIIDLNRARPATASAASNLCRCLLAAATTAFINPLIDAIGCGWAFTLFALIVLVLVIPLLLACVRFGPAMRARKAKKESLQAEKKVTKQEEKV